MPAAPRRERGTVGQLPAGLATGASAASREHTPGSSYRSSNAFAGAAGAYCPAVTRALAAGQMSPASRYSTREPATATFRLAPVPIIGISTATSSRSMASGGMPDRLLSELYPDDAGTRRTLFLEPPACVAAGPVHTGRPSQRVPAGQCLGHPRQARHGEAGADRIAGTQQRAEVGPVQRPQRRSDEVIPAPVPAVPSLAGKVRGGPDPDLRAAHQLGTSSGAAGKNPALLIEKALRGAPGPSSAMMSRH